MQVEWEHGFMILSVVSFTVKVFCMGELLRTQQMCGVGQNLVTAQVGFTKSQY